MLSELAGLLFNLLAAHALCDFPLQGQHMARAKRKGGSPHIPWPFALGCHALIHGGAVSLITGLWWLGVAETIAHSAIDWSKCRGLFGIRSDQALHIICKIAWAVIALGAFE